MPRCVRLHGREDAGGTPAARAIGNCYALVKDRAQYEGCVRVDFIFYLTCMSSQKLIICGLRLV